MAADLENFLNDSESLLIIFADSLDPVIKLLHLIAVPQNLSEELYM